MMTRVEEAIVRSGLFEKGDHVLAAVSGGADSTAMLCALHACAALPGITVSAAYFDHRLRDDSARDGEAVRQLCARRGIPFHNGSGDVRESARRDGESIEAAARRARYRFLEKTRARIGATRIATAHTRDDQVETVLMRMLRGAGIRGLSGIPRSRGVIVRPLLDVTGADTQDCCRAFGALWRDDPSNRDVTHTRNRIRHDTLPALRRADRAVTDDLVEIGETAAAVLAGVRALTDPLLERAARKENDGTWVVDTRALRSLDGLSRQVLFADLFAARMGIECDASRGHFRELGALCERTARSGRMMSLPGITARREHDDLVFFRGVRHPEETVTRVDETMLEVPGLTSVAGARFDAHIVPRNDAQRSSVLRNTIPESSGGNAPRVAYFALESLRLPLVVRSPRRGDRMRPFGMTGRKKLSDIFVDRKIPARERERSLVVCDADEVVWLVGVATSEKTRIEGAEAALVRITVTR